MTRRGTDPSADSGADRSGSESADPTERVMVHQPTARAAGPGYLGRLAAAKRRDVVPVWLRSTAELRTAAGWGARHYAHTAGYHALRSPVYAARLTMQAPTGLARFVGGTMRWVADREGEPVRLAAVRREDAAEYLKLSRQRDGRVRLRTLVAVLGMFVGIVLALAIYVLAPDWLQALSVGALVLALGCAGRQADAPVIHRAVEVPKASKLTSDIVLRARGCVAGARSTCTHNVAAGVGRQEQTPGLTAHRRPTAPYWFACWGEIAGRELVRPWAYFSDPQKTAAYLAEVSGP